MGDYYLRVAGVNLSNSVYDTNDISTIRGGSFILLDTVHGLSKAHEDSLETISAGASEGIFKIKSGHAPYELESKIKSWLNTATDNHFTFVVDTIDGTDIPFKDIQEKLIAANHWSQMQQLSVLWGDGWHGADKACSIDGVRPGKKEHKGKIVSKSVQFRNKTGTELRDKIYSEILGNKETIPKFTGDLEELSKFSGNSSLSHLDGKIAFIYLDGNKFANIKKTFCNDEDGIKNFDKAVQDNHRKEFLKILLGHMNSDENAKFEGKLVQLETLLWGGDEIEWVVPAWKAWDVLKLFYEFRKYFDKIPEELKKKYSINDGVPLTHAAGVVFCHHNALILQIRKLAHSLADKAKDNLSKIIKKQDVPVVKTHDAGDIFQYLVLESFDMLEGSLGMFLKHYYHPTDFSNLVIKGSELSAFSDNMKTIKSVFPRNKVYEIIDVLKHNPEKNIIKDETVKRIDDIRKRALSGFDADVQKTVNEAIDNLLLKDKTERWFAIADLWDFIVEVQ